MKTEQGETALPKKITREDFVPTPTSKVVALRWARATVLTLISALLVSFAAYCLITPNDFTIGGISGIAILVNRATNGKVQQSILLFSINLPLIIAAFFFVKRKFAILSAMNIGFQFMWLFLIENIPALSDFQIKFVGNGEKIFAAIAAGLCIGVAVALAFKVGGSTGGADICAVMIQRKFSAASIAWVIFGINCVIIGSSMFVFKPELSKNDPLYYGALFLPVMMSIFESYIEGKANDTVTNGFHKAIEFRIITSKPDEMAAAMMKELSRGVTAIPATGMYTKITRTMLVCVISRRQVVAMKRIMKAVDPDSFAVMSSASQVLGLGFHLDEN